jgi:hypothetical protein
MRPHRPLLKQLRFFNCRSTSPPFTTFARGRLSVEGTPQVNHRGPHITKDYQRLPKVTCFAKIRTGDDNLRSANGEGDGVLDPDDVGANFTISLPFLYQDSVLRVVNPAGQLSISPALGAQSTEPVYCRAIANHFVRPKLPHSGEFDA